MTEKVKRKWLKRPPSKKRRPASSAPTAEERLMLLLMQSGNSPEAVQHKFHGTRRWKFDMAWPSLRLAVEVEGGIFIRGRHVTPGGYVKDCEKYTTAALEGWSVLRFPVAGKDWAEKAAEVVAGAISRRRAKG